MNIEWRDALYLAGLVFCAGCTWAWLKSQVKKNEDSTNDLERRHNARISKLERSLADENGRPLLVSYADHKNLCDAKQLVSDTKLEAFEKDLNEIKEAVKDIPKLAQMIYELKGKIR